MRQYESIGINISVAKCSNVLSVSVLSIGFYLHSLDLLQCSAKIHRSRCLNCRCTQESLLSRLEDANLMLSPEKLRIICDHVGFVQLIYFSQ